MTDPHAPLTNRLVMLMIVALSKYTALKKLKKSTHCQKYLEMEEQARRRGVDSDVRIKPSSCTDLIQMTHQPSSQPSRAPQIAILPWKYTQGACWTTPRKTMPGNLFMRPKCQNQAFPLHKLHTDDLPTFLPTFQNSSNCDNQRQLAG